MKSVAAIPMRPRTLLWLAIGAGLALFVAANAHLVYVAMMSQPECVAHLRTGDSPNAAAPFSAAKSSCKPQ